MPSLQHSMIQLGKKKLSHVRKEVSSKNECAIVSYLIAITLKCFRHVRGEKKAGYYMKRS